MLQTRSIQGIIVIAVSLFLAIWLGVSVATNQEETILYILGTLTLVVCFAMGRHIWLLIPLGAGTMITLRVPGLPDTLLIAQLLFIAFCIPLFLLRKLPYRFQFSEIEWLILLLTAFVLQVYLRNPAGILLFDTEIIGGKAYILYIISLMSALVLCGLQVPKNDLKWFLRLTILGGIINAIVSAIGVFVPAVGYYTAASFSRNDEVNYEDFGKSVDAGAATRIQFLGKFGQNLMLWIAAFSSPIRALLRPHLLFIILVAIASCMLSGFRSGFLAVIGMTAIAVAYRDGFAGVMIGFLGGVAGLALLSIVNLVNPLPPNIQRSLSFLPGTWEERYLQDGKESTDWRVEIWMEVLLTDRWIQNKWLGDGLGFTAKELQYQMAQKAIGNKRLGISGFDEHRESILASGDYHSGPVQTIRTIGYVGLVALIWFQVRLAMLAHRQILRTRGTEWYPLALLIGIPLIWSPFQFIFIFGTFRDASVTLLLGAGMIRILQNNLPLPVRGISPAKQPILANSALQRKKIQFGREPRISVHHKS